MNNQTTWTLRENGETLSERTETYSLISRIAYLAGVEQRIFENPSEPPKEVTTRLKASSIKDLNILVLLEQACQAVHANMTVKEKRMFFDRCIKSLRIVFACDGQAVIQMG